MRLVIVALLALSTNLVRAETPAPHQMIRALQELQTQIVTGKARAREEQPRMLADIGRHFVATPPETWADPRNARAAIIWVLSGGSPRTMRDIMRAAAFPAEELRLARGALAFSEGRAAQAREMLAPIDARLLDGTLGGQIALVQAALVLPESREKSIEFLGLARLLAPGSLVEETALRRQISLVGQTVDAEIFANLARQYARRFKASLYAEEFRESFAATFTRIGIAAAEDQVAMLEPILASFEADERCRLAVLIARASLLAGAWRSADAFALSVMRPPVDKSCDVPRARLYRAAARAYQPEREGDLIALEMLDPARLSPEDRALRKAALSYARLVRSWPTPREPDAGDVGLAGEARLAQAEAALETSALLLREKIK